MPKNNQYYRLLNEGEDTREGDEWYDPYEEDWTPEEIEAGETAVAGDYPVRRPLDYNPEAVPLMVGEIETEITWIANLIGDIKSDRILRVRAICENLESRRQSLQKALAAANERGAE